MPISLCEPAVEFVVAHCLGVDDFIHVLSTHGVERPEKSFPYLRFSSACLADDKHGVANVQKFSQLNTFGNKHVFSLKTPLLSRRNDCLLELEIVLPRRRAKLREQVLDQLSKNGFVLVDQLWQVEIPESPHKDTIFLNLRFCPFKSSGHPQHSLCRSQSPVVVALLRQ